MAAATTPLSAAEVMDVSNTMMVREEEALIVVVAEVFYAGVVTTPVAVVEVVVEVNTTSTGRWMTMSMDTMGRMTGRMDTVVEVQEEEVTPWTIDFNVYSESPKSQLETVIRWWPALSVCLRVFIMSGFSMHQ
jgi:hypothetical protein